MRSSVSAASDKVNEFQAVSLGKESLRPTLSGDDITVQFDGDAIFFHAELMDQSSYGGGSDDLLLITVESDLHGKELAVWQWTSVAEAAFQS